MELRRRPTADELRAARDTTLPDVIAPNLRVLFCGINPGLYTAAIGHHFGRPGNRFWPVLHRAGFTDRLLSPYDERELLTRGYGITNVVARATAAADELAPAEYMEGGRRLAAKLREYRPAVLAVLGVGAYRGGLWTAQRAGWRAGRSAGRLDGLGAAQPQRAECPLPDRPAR